MPDSGPAPAAGGYSAGGYGAQAGSYGGGGGYGMPPAQQAAPQQQQQQQAYGYPQQAAGAPDYGAQQAAPQAGGYHGGGNLMDAVTAPLVGGHAGAAGRGAVRASAARQPACGQLRKHVQWPSAGT